MDKSHASVAMSAETKALLSRTPPVIEPGHTFESVTESIGHVVLSKRTPIGWFLGFFIAFILLMVLNMTIGNLLIKGIPGLYVAVVNTIERMRDEAGAPAGTEPAGDPKSGG